MKTGWQTSTLGDVLAVIRNGVNCKQDKSGSGDRISRIESISDATFNLEKVGFAKLSERDKEKNRLRHGDILFSHINSTVHVGKTAVFDCDTTVYHGINLLLMRPTEVVTSAYLDHTLKYLFQSGYWRGVCKQSVNQASVNQRDISRVEIRYPKSLTEQQRIVAILDEAFAGLATAKANAEKNLQNARALFESHLLSVFTKRGPGWMEKKISEVAKHSLGKMLDKAKNKGELKPYLRNLNVRWFKFDLSDVLQMPFLPAEVNKYTAIKGDVLICEGGYPGRAAIWNEDNPIYFQKALHRVRFHEMEHSKWFVYFLYAQDKSGELKKHFNGAGIQHFTGEALARYEIPLPPLPELRHAVAKFDELAAETQRLECLYQRKLAGLDELKQSLLHKAFSGEL
jgi:type I restriction enzyme S subunit